MPLNPADFEPTFSPDFVLEAVDAAFEGSPPSLVQDLFDPRIAAEHLLRFAFGPVFSLGGHGPVRLSISDVGAREEWEGRVRNAWPSDLVASFLANGPSECRRMVDVSAEAAEIYLDDLQDTDWQGASPVEGEEVMCATLRIPSHETTSMTRHTVIPAAHLAPEWQERANALLSLGLNGVWGVRWGSHGVEGLLLVTEVRTRTELRNAIEGLEQLDSHPGLNGFRHVVEKAGLRAYPDSIEWCSDGRIDVTMGVLGA